MEEKTTIAFVGVGAMGTPMLGRILSAGFPTVVRDLDDAATKPFASSAKIADSTAEAAALADILVGCLPTLAAYEDLIFGPDSICFAGRLKLYVHAGTTGPQFVHKTAAVLASAGIATLDAPITGGAQRAREGRLTVIASGAHDDFEQAYEFMSSYADNLFHVHSEPGQAQIMKMINNVLSVSNLAIASEALLLGAKAGLDARTMIEIVNKGTGQSDATLVKIPNEILTGRFAHGGALHITEKDLKAFLDTAVEFGIETPLARSVAGAYHEAILSGSSPREDLTAVIHHMEARAGVRLRKRTGGE